MARRPRTPTPPHDLEAETSVLGAILLDAAAIARLVPLLTPADFYRENNGRIYQAAVNLFREGRPIDSITMGAELERSGVLDHVGGRAHLALLQEAVPTAANVEHYARIVKEKAQKRRLIATGARMADLGYDDTVEAAAAVSEVQAQIGAIAHPVSDEESPDAADHSAPAPAFPLSALPAAVVARIERAAAAGLPLDFLGAAALATLAGALGGTTSVAVADEWSERALIWVGLVGQPGAGKSPSVETMAAPLRELQQMLFAAYEEKRREWAALPAKERQRQQRPIADRLVIGDTTVEALVRQLAGQPATTLIADELRGLLTSLGQYKRGGGADRDRLLELWNGGALAYQRATDDVVLYVAEPTLTILGGIQPSRLVALGDGEDGLRARWLLVAAGAQVEGDLPALARGPLFDPWAQLVRSLFGLRESRRQWTLDPAARELFIEARRRWRSAGLSSEEPAPVRELQLKGDRFALRLAVILAEAWRAASLPPDDPRLRAPGLLPAGTVEQAVLLVDYFLAHRRSMRFPTVNLMSRPHERDRDRAVDQLVEWLEGRPGGRATRREIQQARVAGMRTRDNLHDLIERYAATFPGCVWQEASPRGPARTVIAAPRRRARLAGPQPLLSVASDTVAAVATVATNDAESATATPVRTEQTSSTGPTSSAAGVPAVNGGNTGNRRGPDDAPRSDNVGGEAC